MQWGVGGDICDNHKLLDSSGFSTDLGIISPQNIIKLALDLLISWAMTTTLDFRNTKNGLTNRMMGKFINEQVQSNEGLN